MTPGTAPGADDLVVQGPDLSEQAIAAFGVRFPAAALRRQGGSVRFLGAGPAHAVAAPAAELAGRWRCDAAVVPAHLQLSDFKVLALDMDSTLIRIEGIDELARLAGVGTKVAAITEAAMRGQVGDYAESLRRRVALLAGADAALLDRTAQLMELSAGAERLLAEARRAGLRTLLVTGGFGVFARILQQRLGIDTVCANEIVVADGRLAGVVHGPAGGDGRIVDAQGKAEALKRACADAGCATAHAIAIGDGANDLPMLALAGLPVAFHAKPRVRAATRYALDYSGLDGVLEWFS